MGVPQHIVVVEMCRSKAVEISIDQVLKTFLYRSKVVKMSIDQRLLTDAGDPVVSQPEALATHTQEGAGCVAAVVFAGVCCRQGTLVHICITTKGHSSYYLHVWL